MYFVLPLPEAFFVPCCISLVATVSHFTFAIHSCASMPVLAPTWDTVHAASASVYDIVTLSA